MKDFKQKFYDITALIQQEFDRNLELYGDKIQCRRGCSKCCSQIFRITKLDGWVISEHVRSLSETRRNELQQKARDYLLQVPLIKGELGGLENSDHPGFANDSLPLDKSKNWPYSGEWSKTEGVPCPALGTEGECTIYEARPVICRRFGMPIYDYKNPQNVHACELNFKDGDEITDAKLIPNQTEIGMKWDKLKDAFVASVPRTDMNSGTTIAEAIANA